MQLSVNRVQRGQWYDLPMLLRAWARCCLVLGLCGVPTLVAARAPILPGLSWVRLEGAETCISTIALAQRIEDKLGRPVFVPTSAAELTIEGHVAPRPGGGFVSQLSVVAPDGRVLGTRQLESPGVDCAELDDALILVIAVTLVPDNGAAGVSMLSPQAQAALDQWLRGEVPTDVAPSATQPTATVPVPPRAARDTESPRRDARSSRPTVDYRSRIEIGAIFGGGMLDRKSVV